MALTKPKIDTTPQVAVAIEQALKPPLDTAWEDTPFVQEVKQKQALRSDCETAGGTFNDDVCTLPPPPVYAPVVAPVGLHNQGGYIMPGWNCVACAEALTGKFQNGNAGQWVASHSDPRIGDVMIFGSGEQGASWAGHLAVVVGINPDGTINVAHCNWGSDQTTFYSTGKFF